MVVCGREWCSRGWCLLWFGRMGPLFLCKPTPGVWGGLLGGVGGLGVEEGAGEADAGEGGGDDDDQIEDVECYVLVFVQLQALLGFG